MDVPHVEQDIIQKNKIVNLVTFVNREHIQNQVHPAVLLVLQAHIHLIHLQFVYHVQQGHFHPKMAQPHVPNVPEVLFQDQLVSNVMNAQPVHIHLRDIVSVYLVQQENILLNLVQLLVNLVLKVLIQV